MAGLTYTLKSEHISVLFYILNHLNNAQVQHKSTDNGTSQFLADFKEELG